MATCQIIRVFDTVKQFWKRRHFIPNEMSYSVMGSGYSESPSLLRFMTTGRRVQDRSKKKRVHDLEIATEKLKLASKILFLMEVLKREPEQVIPLRSLEQYRRHINLPKPHKISDFIRKSPKLFELYKDNKRVIWCGMTKEAEDLVEEEAKILEEHGEKAAEHVTRLLMMTVDKRLSMDKIAHFRRDFGLPYDFQTRWAYKYPQYFRVVKSEDDVEYLELVSWNPTWAVTELEKKVDGVIESNPPTPGLLTLPFPMKFPPNCKKIFQFGGKIEHFQKRCYLSPYADARGLKAGSQEFDKRAVAVMHELLSFTIEKRVVTDHLTHFRHELVMPQKLMRLLLKHFGIFYVSERGKRFSVFLTEAYDGSELIQKCPLVLWREKVQSLIGYRGRQQRIESFSDFSDMEGYDNLFDSDFKGNAIAELESEDTIAGIEDLSTPDHEMEVREIYTAYTGS
ncbi:protein WHAT'S THIS FACTOR 1 homolog, chloroplastic [Macadamia integrifolia]|uniref:protein WHAT'S THIS FACTOR 1 homolog, chloroplastic n=1 Tax=Macadamia integrifolia TaxID=60698 RepID=UPI001C4F3215|nr:protein WHAT'S THIS FACTOR 1 homolog, chloroplastic [Macadamia integrifolia]XP_042492015.1 protein WHAT'S THIS FACTOR 1 homolog, chloroplastic [Macadamia integrifolia]